MSRNPLTFIIGLVLIVFVAVLGFYYLQEGSFEGAGARMDDTMAEAAENTEEAMEEAGEATEDFVDDLGNDDADDGDVTYK